ncbi:hypothetical protein I6J77_15590 [Rhodanobacter sp. FDAARGOS 1247]|uniref:hypothetical protein n=1 Tax=Rhodanobacter sp. FDAARGOS 1247 TaxID=2778082 RepID=UPI00194ED140|nr:hypothetical protein [Rhodanobacter sp. FDAARGOS 1247]QRP63511.1 hypothetical protein I6J77_15590 [Rhodanobacter sp. FDAARGOS 1247]
MSFVLSSFLLLLTGCAATSLVRVDPPRPGEEHIIDQRYAYLSCDTNFYHRSDAEIAAAKKKGSFYPDTEAWKYFKYAMMASNAYDTPDQFYIPGWTRTDRYETKNDLEFDVYERDGSNPKEIVVAFRGTEFNHLKDWVANIAPIEPGQNKEAATFIAGLRRLHPFAQITTTGHSLGGALAMNMSLRFDGVNAVAFNSSPRAFFRTKNKSNSRVHVFEAGEVLFFLNRTWLRLRMPHVQPVRYNYMDYYFRFGRSLVQEHAIYGLARGLMVSAMSNGSNEAREAFISNIKEADARRFDWKDCAHLYAEAEVGKKEVVLEAEGVKAALP